MGFGYNEFDTGFDMGFQLFDVMFFLIFFQFILFSPDHSTDILGSTRP